MMFNNNLHEVLKRVAKYISLGSSVAIAAYYLPKKMLKMEEIVAIALTAAMVFAILDWLAPDIAPSARFGAGFGIGAGLVGF